MWFSLSVIMLNHITEKVNRATVIALDFLRLLVKPNDFGAPAVGALDIHIIAVLRILNSVVRIIRPRHWQSNHFIVVISKWS